MTMQTQITLPTAHAANGTLDQLFRLDGRKVVIVGAAGGIGKAIVEGIAAHGATVVAVDRSTELAETAAAAVHTLGGQAVPEVCDMLDAASLAALADRHGDASALIILPAALVRKRLIDQSEDEIDLQMDLNIKYTLVLAREFAARMADRGAGSIIGISSVRSVVAEPASGMYAATKAALVMLMRSLGVEFGDNGIRFNTIAPSPVATPLTADVRARQEWVDQVAHRSMLKRWAEPEDFIGPAVFLASDASAFVTGTNIMVDGGWTATDGLARIGS